MSDKNEEQKLADRHIPPEKLIGLALKSWNWGDRLKKIQSYYNVSNKELIDAGLSTEPTMAKYRSGDNRSITRFLQIFEHMGIEVIVKIPDPNKE